MGAGASQRVSAVRWGMTARILWAWVLTIPMTATLAWVSYRVARAVLGP
jgi:PiT family inorganic phosphate transporter